MSKKYRQDSLTFHYPNDGTSILFLPALTGSVRSTQKKLTFFAIIVL